MKEPKVIAFDRRLGVGDIISSLPALYVIKQLYPRAKLLLVPCGNYGEGHFDALFLPKDWHNEYEFYKDEFYKLAQKVLSKFEE